MNSELKELDQATLQQLIDTNEDDRVDRLKALGWDHTNWQAIRESHALTFEQFWGNGDDQAMQWDCGPVHDMAEAAWNRAWEVQQEKLDRLQKLYDEEVHSNRTQCLPLLNWARGQISRDHPQQGDFLDAVSRCLPGIHNFCDPSCLTCLDMGTVCVRCKKWPHTRSCELKDTDKGYSRFCPDECDASADPVIQDRFRFARKDRLLERVLQALDGDSSELEDVVADIRVELGMDPNGEDHQEE